MERGASQYSAAEKISCRRPGLQGRGVVAPSAAAGASAPGGDEATVAAAAGG